MISDSENIEDIIDEDAFVTVRPPRDVHALSMNNLDEMDKSSELNETCYSVPDLSVRLENTELQELKQHINNLEEKLRSADNEIQILVSENCQFKKTIQNLEKRVSRFKNLYTDCISSRKTMTSTKNRKGENKNKKTTTDLNSSYENLKVTSVDNTCIQGSSITKNMHSSANTNIESLHTFSEQIKSSFSKVIEQNKLNSCKELPTDILNKTQHNNNTISRESKTETLKNIYMLGTQQIKGLASNLSQSRTNSKYENYKISAITLPNALTENAISYTKWVSSTHENDAKYIVCFGENDKNPTKLFIELSSFIKQLRNNVIIVLGIRNNKFLNVHKLNLMIKTVCNNSDNCFFIDVDNIFDKKEYFKVLCNKINILIDGLDYKEKHLSLKNRFKKSNVKETNTCRKTFREGTIPYYFQKMTKNIELKNSNNKTLNKIGTIPYYFPIIKRQDVSNRINEPFFREDSI